MCAAPLSVREIFRAAGLRCTRQREVVYSALASTKSHPTAEELFGFCKVHDDGLSLATIYNTLEAMERVGLCRRLHGAAGSASRYDADVSEHVHLTTNDGRLIDLPEDVARRVLDALGPDLRQEIQACSRTPAASMTVHFMART